MNTVFYNGHNMARNSQAYDLYLQWQKAANPRVASHAKAVLDQHLKEVDQRHKELMQRYK